MATAVCAPARPSADDCLAHPLDVVMASFAPTQGQGPWEAELEAGMRGMFSSAEALARIPSLNATPVEQLRPGTLVRYRCMVQDVQDPEFYMALFQQTNVHTGEKILMTGKYRDAMPPQSEPAPVADGEDEGKNVQQRVPLYCVPVPGETKWAADVCTKASAAAVAATAEPAKPRAKRGMSDEAEPVVQPSPPRQRPATGAAPEAASEPQPMDQDATAAPPAPSAPSATGICPPCKPALPQREANFPIAETDGTPCLVKVYGEAGEQIRVHQTLEFVGVLSVAPQLAGFGREEEFTDGIEQTVPYSELPRLHALFHRPVDLVTEAVVLQNAPLAAAAGGLSFPIEHARAALAPQLPALRESFITVATAALGGDRLTAEYLLLHCISRIYHRIGGMCIGQFGLNISGVQPATPPLLSPAPLLAGLLHVRPPQLSTYAQEPAVLTCCLSCACSGAAAVRAPVQAQRRRAQQHRAHPAQGLRPEPSGRGHAAAAGRHRAAGRRDADGRGPADGARRGQPPGHRAAHQGGPAGPGLRVPTPGNFYVNLPPLFLGHFSPIFARFFSPFSRRSLRLSRKIQETGAKTRKNGP